MTSDDRPLSMTCVCGRHLLHFWSEVAPGTLVEFVCPRNPADGKTRAWPIWRPERPQTLDATAIAKFHDAQRRALAVFASVLEGKRTCR